MSRGYSGGHAAPGRAPTSIVLEVTGRLEVTLVGALAASLSVVVINPQQVRDFARVTGQSAKNGSAGRPDPRPLCRRHPATGLSDANEQTQLLAALVARRRQLIEMLTAEKNRLRLAAQQLQKRVQAYIIWLEKKLASTNTDLAATIPKRPVWREIGHDPRCQLAGTRHLDAQRSGGLSGCGPISTGLRHAQGPTHHLRRPRPCVSGSLHGGAGRHPAEPGDSHLLSATLSGGKSEEAGVDGLHAKLLTLLNAMVKS